MNSHFKKKIFFKSNLIRKFFNRKLFHQYFIFIILNFLFLILITFIISQSYFNQKNLSNNFYKKQQQQQEQKQQQQQQQQQPSVDRQQRRMLSVADEPEGQIYKTENCSSSALVKFPSDGFSRSQRQQGWICLHIVGALYCFWFLATVCDDYLIPSIRLICSQFKLDHDVIGATVMAAAVSTPELFMNCIGTFITKDDIGISTIVGSAVFNILMVPAVCGLSLRQFLQIEIDWWPITRDCIAYSLAILSLLIIIYDDVVMWYESFGLIVAYIIFVLVMYYHKKLPARMQRLWHGRCESCTNYHQVQELTPLRLQTPRKHFYNSHYSLADEVLATANANDCLLRPTEGQESPPSPWSYNERRCLLFVIFKWPMNFLLWLTLPNCQQHPTWKYFTFTLAIVWIASISYLIAFLITTIGDTFNIPDAILGLTILAVGMSAAEAASTMLVMQQGQPTMGLSNTLGSNTFGILLSLGLPWLIKSLIMSESEQEYLIVLNSKNLALSCCILLTALLALYVTLACNRFLLNWRVSLPCLIVYIILILLAILIELHVLMAIQRPACHQ